MRDENTLRAGLLAAATILCLCFATGASAQGGLPAGEPPASYGAQVFDVALLRPLGFAATVVGACLFVPAAIVSSPGGKDSISTAWDVFVAAPGDFVFKRDLGSF